MSVLSRPMRGTRRCAGACSNGGGAGGEAELEAPHGGKARGAPAEGLVPERTLALETPLEEKA